MKRALIAFGLSSLIFPGLGQIYNKQRRKGVAIAAFLLLLITILSYRVGRVVYKDVPDGSKIEFAEMRKLINEERSNNPKPFSYFNIIFLVLMVYSSVDAAVTGMIMERNPNNPDVKRKSPGGNDLDNGS